MTALSCGGAPGVAVLGGDLGQLRRRAGRWRLRDWRLRTKLTAVLLVPLVLAGVLGALRVADSLREAGQLDVLARQVSFAQRVDDAVQELQRERHLVVAEVLAPDTADPAALPAQAAQVDRTISALRASDSGARDLGPAATQAYQAALGELSGIRALREDTLGAVPDVGDPGAPDVGDPGAAGNKAITRYTELVEVLLSLNRAVLSGASDPRGGHAEGHAPALAALAVATEQVSRQHAVLLAAMLSGALPAEQQAVLRTAEARFDATIDFFVGVSPQHRQRYADTVTGAAVAERNRILDTALSGALQNLPLDIVPANWDFAAAETAERIRQLRTVQFDQLLTETEGLDAEAWNDAIRDTAVVAALLGLAVLLLVLVVRSLLRPLRMLRTHAFDVADRRLPDAVEKLRVTEDKIGETTVDPVPVYSKEEVGQVARAFDTVHVQAVRLAAEQAMLRGTLNDIFLNLAGRSRHLVERQLKLIDKLESGEQDPQQLSNLFQLDHLATRMRRNSENLLVLAGGELRRGAEREIPVLDMLRAAISEVAEYRRVTLRRPPTATVTGPLGGDLVHLVAELLDNATNAGPPDSTVILGSALTEDGGLLVEITDCGTGLPPGELHEINERLASPPVVDVSVSRQMGLFVVSRLAAQHRIQVRLRQQRGQFGITATVLVPSSLVSTDSSASPDEPRPAAASPSTDPGRSAQSRTAWSDRDVDLPLQVSIVEGSAEGDLFSPSSVGTIRPQRTTEQEWRELVGREGRDNRDNRDNREDQDGRDELDMLAADVAPVSVSQGPPGPSSVAGEPPQEVHEEIFDAVSAWFRERRSEPVGQRDPGGDISGGDILNGDVNEMATPPTGIPSSTTASPLLATTLDTTLEWRSAGDEGWQAANALRSSADFEVTAAGLPKRRPREQLIPGAAGPSPTPSSNGPARTPDDVRGRLSNYQRGLRYGRHARIGPDEQRGYPPQGRVEEG